MHISENTNFPSETPWKLLSPESNFEGCSIIKNKRNWDLEFTTSYFKKVYMFLPHNYSLLWLTWMKMFLRWMNTNVMWQYIITAFHSQLVFNWFHLSVNTLLDNEIAESKTLFLWLKPFLSFRTLVIVLLSLLYQTARSNMFQFSLYSKFYIFNIVKKFTNMWRR